MPDYEPLLSGEDAQTDLEPDAAPSGPTLTRQVFLATFQFSQGDYKLQERLFHYLKSLHPAWRLSAAQSAQLEAACARPAETIVDDPCRHPQRDEVSVGWTLRNELGMLANVLNQPDREDHDALVRELAESVVLHDDHYLDRPYGRHYRPDSSRHYNPYKDSWRSDLCYFGLLGRTTGLADFDQLFVAVGEYWREHLHDRVDPTAATARRVVRIFNRHHPDQLVED